jgi:hypothetical protein
MIGERTYFERFCIAAAILFCALPVLTVLLPPLTDYPNHLVRFWLLAGGTAEPHLAAFYKADWSSALTNTGLDFLAAEGARFFNVEAVAKFLLFVAAAAAPAGAALLSRTIFGRTSYWQVLIFATAWTSPLLTGLFSFELGIGIALLFAWLDYATADRRSWIGFCRRALQGFAALLIHPFGFAYYALLTAGLALGCEKRCLGFHALPGSAKRIALASLPLAVSVLLLALRSLSMPYAAIGTNAGYELTWQPMGLEDFALRLIEPLRSYELSADLVFVAALAAPVVWALARGALLTHAGLMVVAGGLAILSLAAPEQIGSTSHINVRLFTMAMFTFAAGAYPALDLSRRSQAALACLALLTVGMRSVWIEEVWRARQTDVVSLYAALEHLPEGSRVLPVDAASGLALDEPIGRRIVSLPTYRHFAAMAVMRRHAFVPIIFAEKGKQPLTILPPYDELLGLDPPGIAQLSPEKSAGTTLKNWKRQFDYVLLFNAGIPSAGREAATAGLTPVSVNGFVALYRVLK